MPDLLNKLNVLVRSSLNTFLGSAADRVSALPAELLKPERLGKDIDQEVGALRKQVDAAISEEDAMQKQLDDLSRQAESYSQQADTALQTGDEPNARLLIQQHQQMERRAAMLQADLEQHKRATSDLIQHVNVLDAMLSDKRRDQTPTETPQPGETSLSSMLRDARIQTQDAPAVASTPDQDQGIPIKINLKMGPAQPDNTSQSTPKKSDDSDDDGDLAKRRARLSKPE